MVDDLIDTFLVIISWGFGLALLVVWALFLFDIANNGVNDCSDDPKYCVTTEELQREWPQFNG